LLNFNVAHFECVFVFIFKSSIDDNKFLPAHTYRYADKLEAILLQRLSITHELQRRLADFRAKSRAEETVSRRMSTAKPRNGGGDW